VPPDTNYCVPGSGIFAAGGINIKSAVAPGSRAFSGRGGTYMESSRLSRTEIAVIVGIGLAAMIVPKLLSLYVDWLWFSGLQFKGIFEKEVTAQTISSLAGFAAGFVITYISIAFALGATKGRAVNLPAAWDTQLVRRIVDNLDKLKLIMPAMFGLIVAVLFHDSWFDFLSYFNAVPFGHSDPIFHKDVSFYLFAIPVFDIIGGTVLSLLVISFLLVAGIYLARGTVSVRRNGVAMEKVPSIHLTVLGALLFWILAFNAYIQMHEIIYSSHGHVAGATYADVHAMIPFLKVQLMAAIIAGLLVLSNLLLKKRWLVVGTIGAYVVLTFLGGLVYPSLLQKFLVAPSELEMETPYIRYNIAATRKAFDLNRVEEKDISGDMALSNADIERNKATIDNIRLWERRPLLDTFGQVQEIRTYYQFVSIDNDRYMIDGRYRQTLLSPRELSTESIPTRNWINEVLTFTHGYGLTLGLSNEITPDGLPVMMIKDIPPGSTAKGLQVKRPEIYYGELASDYVIVDTKAKEFNYPSEDGNVYDTYAGKGGLRVGSDLRKLIFAEYFGSLKLFLSRYVTPQSKIMFKRNITKRVQAVMPFLVLDRDPYMVISKDGELFWIYDAYTESSRFPYSQPFSGINYIRNSVKVTINAYDGSMKFYIADEDDPIIRTISRIFPGILKPISDMPPDLRKHIRYPKDIFSIQTAVYTTYHMRDPQTFYNREDEWEIPVMGGRSEHAQMDPYYTIMKLPGEKSEEYILMLPFTPKEKDNLSAWMAARCDGGDYGKLIVYRFPKDRLVYGPQQIVARINQEPEISQQLSLWNQRGSDVRQGTLFVIPVENSLIYVQPLYIRAETGKIPELKRVIVAYEDRIAMDTTLDGALASIFGQSTMEKVEALVRPAPSAVPEVNLPSRAVEHFERAMEAQRRGDWPLYGEEIQKLGDILRRMNRK
jgi:uncharacterized membrane protein (UPF0182 family)